jgi:hypothetical protein
MSSATTQTMRGSVDENAGLRSAPLRLPSGPQVVQHLQSVQQGGATMQPLLRKRVLKQTPQLSSWWKQPRIVDL